MYKSFQNVEKSLTSSLYRARKRIEYNKDIYMDENHKTMCEYYKKYQEISKEFSGKKTNITYKTFKIDKHILSDTHDDDEIVFKKYEININLLYNDYNKKFINNLYVTVNPDDYNEFIESQNAFIKSLTSEELYTLRCHTHDGDVIVNYFINNNFNIDVKIDEVNYHDSRKSKIIVNKKEFNSNRDYILFYYQIKKYLYNTDKKFKDYTRIGLEDYIKENYVSFDWKNILKIYIKDIHKIFEKSPVIKKPLVFYRGVNDEYYIKGSANGNFISKTLNSASFNFKVAVSYMGGKCCVMRIKITKGSKIILIDNVSNYNEGEVLLPFNTKYYIDYPRHEISYYKTSEICPDESKSKKIIVSDLSVIEGLRSYPRSSRASRSPRSPRASRSPKK